MKWIVTTIIISLFPSRLTEFVDMFRLNMKNNQNISLLFWHRKSKQDKNGYAQIICRISIKGRPKAEISTGKKAHLDEWDLENKKAKGKDKEPRK